MAADGQQAELIVRLELGQTDGTIASGEVAGDRAECEDWERIEQSGGRRVALLLGG